MRTLNFFVAIHFYANRSTHISHIIIFPLAKAFATGNVKGVLSVITALERERERERERESQRERERDKERERERKTLA